MTAALLLILAIALNLASAAYVSLSAWRFARFRRRQERSAGPQPPVTILKPLYGTEPGLYENLRSFCDQDYPVFQVVFGLKSENDGAVEVVRRLMADLPDRDLALVIDGHVSGRNLKASNLHNMMRAAKHDLLFVADSDMRVGRDYLTRVVAPFDDPGIGAVTCLYRGTPVGGLASGPASVLGAMFINEWFLPSVLVALTFEPLRYCFGATMAVRRNLLDAAGGFAALAQYLADDHMLGKLVAGQGYKVHLSPYVVENMVAEPSLTGLFSHELRWARTVRTVRPGGYAASFIMYAVPLAILAAAVNEATLAWHAVAAGSLLIGLMPRIFLHYQVRSAYYPAARARPWLVPVRDLLCFVVWATSFLGRAVRWRDQDMLVRADGLLSSEKVRNS